MSRNIVPRSDKDADLGTALKNWNNIYTDKLTLRGSDLQALLDGKTDIDTLIAKGDLYVATDAGVIARLPRGNDGEILKVNSGTIEGLQWAPGGAKTELTSDITVTVGSGGNYATINEALASLVALYYPVYLATGVVPQATINLLSGFVMAEQVLIECLDLSWITITGVDAETMITRSALTRNMGGRRPAFGAVRGTLPVIGQLFNMDISGVATYRDGVFCNFGRCYINSAYSACGVKNAGDRGISAEHGSTVIAEGADISGAGAYGIFAASASTVDARSVNASGAGEYGVCVVSGSTVNAQLADASGAGSRGIYASNGSTVNAEGVNASGAGEYGVYVVSGSTINATSATGTSSPAPNTLTSRGIIFQ